MWIKDGCWKHQSHITCFTVVFILITQTHLLWINRPYLLLKSNNQHVLVPLKTSIPVCILFFQLSLSFDRDGNCICWFVVKAPNEIHITNQIINSVPNVQMGLNKDNKKA